MQMEWVKVPEGEFITGISDLQREMLYDLIWKHYGVEKLNAAARAALFRIVVRNRSNELLKTENMPPEERAFVRKFQEYDENDWTYLRSDLFVSRIPPQTRVWLPTFYIARYPITYAQIEQIKHIDHSIGSQRPPNFGHREFYPYGIDDLPAALHPVVAIEVVNLLGARFPTTLEWEKAARGTEGNLYPWGDTWKPECCHLTNQYPHGKTPQRVRFRTRVRDYPCGVSPFGAWDMIGNVGEYVRSPKYPTGAITVSDHLAVNSDSTRTRIHLPCVAALSSRTQHMGLDENGHFTGVTGILV